MSKSNNLFSVVGKNVLITGGSRGIGYMIAKGYVEAGANVIVTSRDEKACIDAATTINCQWIQSNVSNRIGCEQLADNVRTMFNNKLDVLINNAGTSWGEPLSRNSKSNWGFDKIYDLNVKGIFYLTRACIPLLSHSTTSIYNPSCIINIGSVAGIIPQGAPTYAYDTSKAAVHHLTKKFASELACQHITVNCIAPGYIPTRMSTGLTSWGINMNDVASATPLGRLGNEDDMTGACIYLSSKAGSYCTGVILNVDGGCIGAQQIQLISSDTSTDTKKDTTDTKTTDATTDEATSTDTTTDILRSKL